MRINFIVRHFFFFLCWPWDCAEAMPSNLLNMKQKRLRLVISTTINAQFDMTAFDSDVVGLYSSFGIISLYILMFLK